MRTLRLIAAASIGGAVLAYAPAYAGGFDFGGFAGGFSEGYARGAEIRARHAQAIEASEEAKRERLCNKALEDYLAGKGPVPPPMCNPPGDVASAPPEAPPQAVPETTPAKQTSFMTCTPDAAGGSHCSTITPGEPITFTNCSVDAAGDRHCQTD